MTFDKDPDAVLDYEFDWSDWLPTGDTIDSYTVAADTPLLDETGLVIDSDSATSTAVTVWLSGGTVAESYEVVCHIVTTAGREDDRTAVIVVKER